MADELLQVAFDCSQNLPQMRELARPAGSQTRPSRSEVFGRSERELYKISITYVRFSFLKDSEISASPALCGCKWLKTDILIWGIYCMANWHFPCKSRSGIGRT